MRSSRQRHGVERRTAAIDEHEVILPSETRSRIAGAFALLENKRQSVPPKKHGNIPL